MSSLPPAPVEADVDKLIYPVHCAYSAHTKGVEGSKALFE